MTFESQILKTANRYVICVCICVVGLSHNIVAQHIGIIKAQKNDSSVFFYALSSNADTIHKQQAFVFHVPKSKQQHVVFKIYNGYLHAQNHDTLILHYRPGLTFELFTDQHHNPLPWTCLIDGTTNEPPKQLRIQCRFFNTPVFEERYTIKL
jgi:hypothetical protein